MLQLLKSVCCFKENSCPQSVAATWINSSGERLLLCDEHLNLCLKVYEVDVIEADCYQVRREKDGN